MEKFDFKKIYPHAIAVVAFIAISLTYFSPVLEGKKLRQGDIKNFTAAAKEICDYRDKTGEEALWTNSMFGGMPAYQISYVKGSNLVKYVDTILTMGMPRPASDLFLYLIGFYILLVCMKIDPVVSIIGAIAFAFSSYFFIILEAGHNTKAHAIAYMAPVLAGIIIAYRGKYLLGGIITALFFALELKANHLQITYYLGIVLAIYGLSKLIEAAKAKDYTPFLKASGTLILAIVLALGTNIGNLWSTYEYGKVTTRGKSELTIVNKENQTSGLDKDYATAWSYGVGETFTFLVPDFKGGESAPIASDPELIKDASPQNQQLFAYAYKYHGDQPFTSGPVYIGAIVCFLFVLGIIYIEGSFKWVMVISCIISILLGWGKNFMPLTDFFLDFVPGYNKFRAVSMILVIAELVMPILAFIALDKMIKNVDSIKGNLKKLYLSIGISGGLALLIAIAPTMFTDFANDAADANLQQQLKGAGMSVAQSNLFFEEVEDIRMGITTSDAWRSLLLILLSGGAIWLFTKDVLKKNILLIALAALVVFDMWGVNKRYLNNQKNERGKYLQWESKNESRNPFQASPADNKILQDQDPNFRVWNTTIRLDQDGRTPYFHKAIGGYHGAKLRRYQELIDMHLNRQNMKAYNMLNTKYIIVQDKQQGLQAQRNPGALGNAWFVDEFKLVASADSEITALSSFDPAKQCIVDKRFNNQLEGFSSGSNHGTIKLTQYDPRHLTYQSESSQDELAVFSEIYYEKGWNAYIDGTPVDHFRCNYVLRGLKIPAGSHKIEFKFEPIVHSIGGKVSFACSLLLLLAAVGIGYKELKG